MRSISRTVGISINTVTKLLIDAGSACAKYHDNMVRNLNTTNVQCDEIWAFCYSKQKNVANAKSAPDEAGDLWTWTAIDSDSKLVISYLVGGRSAEYANIFMSDVASRLNNKVQLTTDGLHAYLEAVEGAFGNNVDYKKLVKVYDKDKNPNKLDNDTIISTSFVERLNLTIRMAIRRMTRSTNAFSKKGQNHVHMKSLYFVYYNFCRIHKTLRVTPAMEVGLTNTLYDMDFIIDLIEQEQTAPVRPKTYKKLG